MAAGGPQGLAGFEQGGWLAGHAPHFPGGEGFHRGQIDLPKSPIPATQIEGLVIEQQGVDCLEGIESFDDGLSIAAVENQRKTGVLVEALSVYPQTQGAAYLSPVVVDGVDPQLLGEILIAEERNGQHDDQHHIQSDRERGEKRGAGQAHDDSTCRDSLPMS